MKVHTISQRNCSMCTICTEQDELHVTSASCDRAAYPYTIIDSFAVSKLATGVCLLPHGVALLAETSGNIHFQGRQLCHNCLRLSFQTGFGMQGIKSDIRNKIILVSK